MPVTPNSLKLDMFLGKSCKVVYRDGPRTKAFYGILKGFDDKFQTWEGGNERNPRDKFVAMFNHADVSRIVMSVGGGPSA